MPLLVFFLQRGALPPGFGALPVDTGIPAIRQRRSPPTGKK
jgi:hypothetical protein